MARSGKPREATSGKHEYTREQSLRYWQQRWKEEFDALPEHKRQERIAHITFLLRTARRGGALWDLAACCGITKDGDDECVDK